MQDLFIIKLMNNFTVAMKSGGAMALPAPPVAPPLYRDDLYYQNRHWTLILGYHQTLLL